MSKQKKKKKKRDKDEEKVTIEIILIVNNTNCLPYTYLLSFHYSHLKCPLDDTQEATIPRQTKYYMRVVVNV